MKRTKFSDQQIAFILRQAALCRLDGVGELSSFPLPLSIGQRADATTVRLLTNV